MTILAALTLLLIRLVRASVLLPLALAWIALRARSTTFQSCCRLALTRTGTALALGACVLVVFLAAIVGVGRWIESPHGPGMAAALTVLGTAVCVMVSAGFFGQAVALVVVGTLARRAPLEERPYLAAAIGCGIVFAAGLIPFFGRTVTLVMSALGLGALALHARAWRRGAAAALLLLAAGSLPARAAQYHEMTEKQIAKDLRKIHKRHPDLRGRVEAVSERFLGTPYVLGPLGEGPDGEYDREPLYSFKRLDCTTYIEEVMALSLEPDLDRALRTLQKIRYEGGKISYETRNHFTEMDWVPHNRWAGYLKDITMDVAPDKARTATKKISKRDWYVHKDTSAIEGFGDEEAEKERRLTHLRELGAKYQDQFAALPYVPMSILPQIEARIPSGTLANLVRADQPDKETMVSHQVLLIRKGKTLYVRHAAFGKAVEDDPALEYFYRYFNSPWPLLGLNLNAITQPK